jgi:cysteine synthase
VGGAPRAGSATCVGTGATFVGIARALKARTSAIVCATVEPEGVCLRPDDARRGRAQSETLLNDTSRACVCTAKGRLLARGRHSW